MLLLIMCPGKCLRNVLEFYFVISVGTLTYLTVCSAVSANNDSECVSTGPHCVETCSSAGIFQSCRSCNEYLACTQLNNVLTRIPCPEAGLMWDDNEKECLEISSTCQCTKQGLLRKVVIDTDPGTDDAHAINIMLSPYATEQNIKVIAILVAHGNALLSQCLQNLKRLLIVAKKLNIPVYKGSDVLFNGKLCSPLKCNSTNYHGRDAFGDIPDHESIFGSTFSVQNESADDALVRIVNENIDEITLLALAPLTNVARALRKDPDLGKKLKDCTIMGGNYQAQTAAEYNFGIDPEAADFVLKNMKRLVTLVTWDFVVENAVSWEFYKKMINIDSHMMQFLKSIETKVFEIFFKYGKRGKYKTADQLAAAVTIGNGTLIKQIVPVNASVILSNGSQKGQLTSDWNSRTPNVQVVVDIDMDVYEKILWRVAIDTI